MKFIRSSLLMSTAIAAAFQLSAFAQSASQNHVRVTGVSGNVTYSVGGGAFEPVPVGARLHKGDVIKTAASSRIDLEVGKNVGVVQLTPGSTLTLGDLTVTQTPAETISDTQLELNRGAIYAQVNKLSKASRFEVKTPAGIAGVRGTKLFLTADGDLTVAEGTAGIAYPVNGGVETHVVKQGQTVSRGDKAPREAPGQILRDIVQALRESSERGIGRDLRPFVPPLEPFISPTLPPRNGIRGGGAGGGGGAAAVQ